MAAGARLSARAAVARDLFLRAALAPFRAVPRVGKALSMSMSICVRVRGYTGSPRRGQFCLVDDATRVLRLVCKDASSHYDLDVHFKRHTRVHSPRESSRRIFAPLGLLSSQPRRRPSGLKIGDGSDRPTVPGAGCRVVRISAFPTPTFPTVPPPTHSDGARRELCRGLSRACPIPTRVPHVPTATLAIVLPLNDPARDGDAAFRVVHRRAEDRVPPGTASSARSSPDFHLVRGRLGGDLPDPHGATSHRTSAGPIPRGQRGKSFRPAAVYHHRRHLLARFKSNTTPWFAPVAVTLSPGRVGKALHWSQNHFTGNPAPPLLPGQTRRSVSVPRERRPSRPIRSPGRARGAPGSGVRTRGARRANPRWRFGVSRGRRRTRHGSHAKVPPDDGDAFGRGPQRIVADGSRVRRPRWCAPPRTLKKTRARGGGVRRVGRGRGSGRRRRARGACEARGRVGAEGVDVFGLAEEVPAAGGAHLRARRGEGCPGGRDRTRGR